MSDSRTTDARNPFYILLIVVSLGFVITALAYAVVPVIEQKAREAGSPPPPSPFREALRRDGWLWLLCQGGAVAALSLLSMGYDRLLRALKKPAAAATIAAGNEANPTGVGPLDIPLQAGRDAP